MKKLFQRIFGWFRNTLGDIFDDAKKYAKVAMQITESVKMAVESPVLNLVVNLIPGEVDNVILNKLQEVMPKVATQVAIAHGIIDAASSSAGMWEGIILELRKWTKNERVSFWMEFSARLTQALADEKISLAEAGGMAQMIYAEYIREQGK